MIANLLQQHSIVELWDFPLLVILFSIGICYIILAWVLDLVDQNTIRYKQTCYFIGGLLLTALTIGGPLHLLGHAYLFSVHMLQQAVLYMVVVPLIMLGTPRPVFQMIIRKSKVKRVVGFLTNPIVSILFFNGLFSIYHFPVIFDAVMANHSLFNLAHFILLVGAVMMWWSLLSPLPEMSRLKDLHQIGFIFMSGALITPVCALIIFSTSPMYATYVGVPQLVNFLTPIEDQRLGGIVMKLIQEGVFITAIAIIFFKWAKKERLKEPEMIV